MEKNENKNKPSTWNILSKINCNEHVEEKNGLKYLSWAWAWGIVREKYSDANYEVTFWDGKPYLFDEDLGYIVQTKVTINNETISMLLPVMDNNNKAMKNKPYIYKIKEYKRGIFTGNYIDRRCEAATMFDINTAIMRCLTKNIAMFGLGHYIYAGEDLPLESEPEIQQQNLEQSTKKVSVNKIQDDVLDKYLNLSNDNFPYTIKNKTYNSKIELINEIIKYVELTDTQKVKVQNAIDGEQ